MVALVTEGKGPEPVPAVLRQLKRILAATLIRAGLDTTDELLILNAFLNDFRWRSGEKLDPGQIARHWQRALPAMAPTHMLSLYVHFPYCRSRCSYCLYASRATPSQGQIADYIPDIQKEMTFFAKVFAGRRFRRLAVGGGTPSLLNRQQLRRAYGGLFDKFRYDGKGILSIECSPASVSPEKIQVLRELGFNRVSFGVQSLDRGVLSAVKRGYQSPKMVADAIRWSQEAGFDDINVDLIFGLLGDTPRTFLGSFDAAARMGPTTITVCGLTLTDPYMRAGNISRAGYHRHYQEQLKSTLGALRADARRRHYEIGDLDPARGIWSFPKESTPARLRERWVASEKHADEPCSIVGLGSYSRSHLYGRISYERGPQPFAERGRIYRAAALSRKDEMGIFLLYSMENQGRVDFAAFRRKFGGDLRQEFSWELEALRRLGAIRPDGQGVAFLARTPPERIFYGMFFLIDALSRTPFSQGRLSRALLSELSRRLSPKTNGLPA